MSYEDCRTKLDGMVGKIAVDFERISHHLFRVSVSILTLRGLDKRAAETLLRDYQFDGLRQTWRKLMDLHYVAEGEIINQIDRAIQDAARARNNSVHLLWSYDDEERKFVGESRKGKGLEVDWSELENLGSTVSRADSLMFTLWWCRHFLKVKRNEYTICELYELDENGKLRTKKAKGIGEAVLQMTLSATGECVYAGIAGDDNESPTAT